MSCPTCDKTMKYVGSIAGDSVFWCEVCGTIKDESGDPEVPKLVGRCRVFERDRGPALIHHGEWVRLGIAESINLPGARPQ